MTNVTPFKLYVTTVRDAKPQSLSAIEVQKYIQSIFGSMIEIQECSSDLLNEFKKIEQLPAVEQAHAVAKVLTQNAPRIQTVYFSYAGNVDWFEDRWVQFPNIERFLRVSILSPVCSRRTLT